ncbi:SIR2 family protein [Aliarcobacter butzleri]|uniref:SIR2 family protein n=1 Tax=Aliarcobacter butzleri TaxID=28197 RepID=UPI00263CC877|nr:SIR2 family protein [Aliarcobacter butzleri]MDN5077962.1 SIR2 family protein [Aliarcobacter butzleri]MDN5119383.1 SIR2 family protein [Aliarcobacter butzleri]
MATESINLHDDKYLQYITKRHPHENWTLCLGAGICFGIMPSWYELTIGIINKVFNYTWTIDDFEKYNKNIGFSLDSWIQGCQNYHINIEGKTRESFNEILEFELYKDLLNKAEEYKLLDVVKKLFEKPDYLKKDDIFKICDFFDQEYGKTTLLQLVKVLSRNNDEIKLPEAIITLNADSLLPSLIRVYQIRNYNEQTPEFIQPPEKFVKITNSYNKKGDKIPIFQLHGTISPSFNQSINDNRDNLIFLEDSYNEISANMYSWAQSTFLYYAQNNKMIFIGLSMTDSNIRKWLNWTNKNNLKEINKKSKKCNLSLQHLWITIKKESDLQKFLNVSLHHLGVKLAFINNWTEIEDRLNFILKKQILN